MEETEATLLFQVVEVDEVLTVSQATLEDMQGIVANDGCELDERKGGKRREDDLALDWADAREGLEIISGNTETETTDEPFIEDFEIDIWPELQRDEFVQLETASDLRAAISGAEL